MSSRFFAAAESSSDEERLLQDSSTVQQDSKMFQRKFMADSSSEEFEESETESSHVEEEPVLDEGEKQREKEMQIRRSRFLIGGESESESDEDVQRVVKSHKEKLHEDVLEIIETMGDAIDADEWTTVVSDFERLLKLATRVIRYGPLPDSFHDFIDFLGDVLEEKSGDHVKKLKADEARAFNTVKHKFKKTDFETFRGVSTDLPIESTSSNQRQSAASSQVNVVELDDITPESIPIRIREILGSRGKRKAAAQENSEISQVFKKCLQVASTPQLRSQVLVAMLSTMFDSSSMTMSMSIDHLINLLDHLNQLSVELEGCSGRMSSVKETSSSEDYTLTLNYAVSYSAFLQRCDDEFSLSLNGCDHHSPAYLEMARVEQKLIAQLRRSANCVFPLFSLVEATLECKHRLLNRIYYRSSVNVEECKELLVALYQSPSETHQAHALLCHCHILAVRNRFIESKDLLIASHLPENISRFPIFVQILFNRCLVQLGLAAFRLGLIMETYFCLHELCSSGRPKELVGQGLPQIPSSSGSRGHYQHPERSERLRLLPHHCHLNIELIDTVFSISSMLLELPQAAAQHSSIYTPIPRKQFNCRHLKRILDSHERSLFNGPPENTRETIVAACKALSVGDWRHCLDLLCNGIKIWGSLFPEGNNGGTIRKILGEKVRRSALLLSIYTLASYLPSISVSQLASQFDLDPEVVKECLSAHSCLMPSEGSSDNFNWKDQKQLRHSFMERTMAHLRELTLPLFSSDSAVCEFIVYGQQSGPLANTNTPEAPTGATD